MVLRGAGDSFALLYLAFILPSFHGVVLSTLSTVGSIRFLDTAPETTAFVVIKCTHVSLGCVRQAGSEAC